MTHVLSAPAQVEQAPPPSTANPVDARRERFRAADQDALSPLVLHSSRRRPAALLAGFVFLTACGALVVKAEAGYGWPALGFGLVGAAVFGFTLVRPGRLELSASGLATVALGRRWSAQWSECGEFRTWKDYSALGASTLVIFDCRTPDVRSQILEVVAEVLTGANAALPETYGMPAAKLAALLNRYRRASADPPAAKMSGDRSIGNGDLRHPPWGILCNQTSLPHTV